MIASVGYLRITMQAANTAAAEKFQEPTMTKSEVKKFRNVLEASVIELDGSTRQRDAIVIEGSADELDRGLQAAERELAVRSLEAVSARRRETRAALQRIQEGTYGICLECEETISPARLSALPWATRCIRCQEPLEFHRGTRNAQPALAMAA